MWSKQEQVHQKKSEPSVWPLGSSWGRAHRRTSAFLTNHCQRRKNIGKIWKRFNFSLLEQDLTHSPFAMPRWAWLNLVVIKSKMQDQKMPQSASRSPAARAPTSALCMFLTPSAGEACIKIQRKSTVSWLSSLDSSLSVPHQAGQEKREIKN